MSELPPGIRPATPAEPRESASGVLVRPAPDGAEVLLVVRSRQSRFMPGFLAFPGGAVDSADGSDEGRFVRCVAREVEEETGVVVAPERWLPAGERITPPMFPLRFRTRFFVAELPAGVEDLSPASEEIESMRVAGAGRVHEGWRRGECQVPPPALPILRELSRLPEAGAATVAGVVGEANAREERAPRMEFAPDVWALPVRTETLPPATHTNVWMPGAAKFVVIDPAAESDDERDRLMQVIERRARAGSRPSAVLLTHGHRDHAGGALEVARRLAVPLRAHRTVLESTDAGSGAVPLSDGETIDLGGELLRAVHTPGHAPGHLAFLVEGRRLLVAGDLVSGMSTVLIDPETGDMAAYLRSLRVADGLGARLLLPGHGPPMPAAALGRVLDHRLDRERKVLGGIRGESASVEEIARAAYDDLPEMPVALTERQTLAHLVDLERQGRVRRAPADDRRWSPA